MRKIAHCHTLQVYLHNSTNNIALFIPRPVDQLPSEKISLQGTYIYQRNDKNGKMFGLPNMPGSMIRLPVRAPEPSWTDPSPVI